MKTLIVLGQMQLIPPSFPPILLPHMGAGAVPDERDTDTSTQKDTSHIQDVTSERNHTSHTQDVANNGVLLITAIFLLFLVASVCILYGNRCLKKL